MTNDDIRTRAINILRKLSMDKNNLTADELSIISSFILLERENHKKLIHYGVIEEQGLLLKLQESDWNDLIKQLATIIANDFIVYSEGREFCVKQIVLSEHDEEFSFDAACQCFNGAESECYEDCKYREDGKGCCTTFSFSDIGKFVFLNREESKVKMKGGIAE